MAAFLHTLSDQLDAAAPAVLGFLASTGDGWLSWLTAVPPSRTK